MAEGVSQRELARILGVSEGAVRKALLSKRIRRLPSGLIDPESARAAWSAGTDPVRTKVRTSSKVRTRGTHPIAEVRSEADARKAVSLVARVLADEGSPDDGKGVDFSKARTAELILKARQRELDQAVQGGKLVDRAAAEKAFFEEARTLRDGLLAWPARIAIEAAEEIRVDPKTGKVDVRSLTAVLDRYMRQHLTEMGEPEQLNLRTAV